MKHWLSEFIKKENDVDDALANIIRNVLIVSSLAYPALGMSQLDVIVGTNRVDIVIILIGIELLVLGLLALTFRKVYWPTRILLPATTLVILTYLLTMKNGLHNGAVAGYPTIIFLTGLLRRRQSLPFWMGAVAVSIGFVGYWDMAGLTPEDIAKTTNIGTIGLGIVFNLLATGLTYILLRRFENIIAATRLSESAQISANQELRNLQTNLEQRVLERTAELESRTRELEEAKQRVEHRATDLQSASDIARTITSIKSIDTLLPRVVTLINTQFNLYHTGLWMIDETDTFAVLSASTDESGKQLIAQGFKLRLGGTGIISRVAASGEHYLAADTETDPYYMFTEQLPLTRSELTMPIKTGNRTIAVLDVQGDVPNRFKPEDISLLTALASQIATSIENARLFQQSASATAEMQNLLGQMVRQDWARLSQESIVKGYRYNGVTSSSLTAQEDIPQTLGKGALSIPIKIRGEIVGHLDISNPIEKNWERDEMDVIQAISERIALAFENARLLEDSQKRASKERTIGEISSKISSSVNLDSVFRTLMEELGQILPGSEIVVQFANEETPQAQ